MSRPKYPFELYAAEPVNSLREIVSFAAEHYGERTAFVYQEKITDTPVKISYLQYEQDIKKVATGLVQALKIDLTRRDSKKIAILAPNSYWWSVVYLAVVNINQVIVPLDPNLPAEDLITFIQRAGVSSIVFAPGIEGKIAQMKTALAKIEHYIGLKESAQATITLDKIIRTGERLLHKKPSFYDEIAVFPEALATVIFTSGTTSTPKGVMLTHKNLATDVCIMKQFLHFDREITLSMLPLYHSYEFTFGLLLQIYSGTTIYYLPGGLPAFQENLAKVRPTMLILVPLIVEETYRRVRATLSHPDDRRELADALKEYFGGRVTRIFDGGAPINSDIAAVYSDCGIELIQGYGITECSPVVCLNPDRLCRSVSVGLPLPGVRVKLHDKGEDGVGEVIVRGPIVMLGYYKDERQTDLAVVDNWFYTGDFGRFDDDGFLYIVGRKKNVIVGKNAKKVYPEEVEYHLTCQPEIREAMVYGKQIDDDTKVAALLVLDRENLAKTHPELPTNPTSKQISTVVDKVIDRVNSANVKYKHILSWEITDALPRTTTGKIKRAKNHLPAGAK